MYTEAPQIMTRGAETLLIGWPTFAYHTGLDTLRSGIMGDATPYAGAVLRGKEVMPLPLPIGVTSMPRSRSAAVSAGQVGVIWLRPADSVAVEARFLQNTWNGTGWQSTVEVSGDINATFGWSNRVSAPSIIEGEPTFVVTPGLPVPGVGRIISWKSGSWHLSSLDGITDLYPALAPSADSTRILAYVAYGAPDGNTVFVRSSVTRGKAWGPVVRLSTAGEGEAFDPLVVVVEKGLTIVAWGSQSRDGAGALHLAATKDQGMTWAAHTPLRVQQGIRSVRAVADGTGSVHFVFQTQGKGSAHFTPHYARWTRRGWIAHASPPDSIRAFGIASIGYSPEGDVLIAWGEEQSHLARNAIVTAVARLNPACRPMGSRDPDSDTHESERLPRDGEKR
jgi:hypothetical protein